MKYKPDKKKDIEEGSTKKNGTYKAPKVKLPIGEIIRRLVIVSAVITIAVCGFFIGKYYIELAIADQKLQPPPDYKPTSTSSVTRPSTTRTTQTSHAYDTTNPPEPEPWEPVVYDPPTDEQYAYYRSMGPDVFGVMHVPGLPYPYPVVKGTDNQFYLSHLPDQTQSCVGSIFLDKRFSTALNEFNNPIYGHNMNDGSMFAMLVHYQYGDIFDNYPTGWIRTDNGLYQLQIFACTHNEGNDMIYHTGSFSEEDVAAHLNHIREIAATYRDIGVGPGDVLLTLSTCSYEGYLTDPRTVVHCRMVPM